MTKYEAHANAERAWFHLTTGLPPHVHETIADSGPKAVAAYQKLTTALRAHLTKSNKAWRDHVNSTPVNTDPEGC